MKTTMNLLALALCLFATTAFAQLNAAKDMQKRSKDGTCEKLKLTKEQCKKYVVSGEVPKKEEVAATETDELVDNSDNIKDSDEDVIAHVKNLIGKEVKLKGTAGKSEDLEVNLKLNENGTYHVMDGDAELLKGYWSIEKNVFHIKGLASSADLTGAKDATAPGVTLQVGDDVEITHPTTELPISICKDEILLLNVVKRDVATDTNEPSSDDVTTDDAPTTDNATTDAPTTDNATTDDVATDNTPSTDDAVITTDAPTTDNATTDAPTTDDATTDDVATDDAPTTDVIADIYTVNEDEIKLTSEEKEACEKAKKKEEDCLATKVQLAKDEMEALKKKIEEDNEKFYSLCKDAVDSKNCDEKKIAEKAKAECLEVEKKEEAVCNTLYGEVLVAELNKTEKEKIAKEKKEEIKKKVAEAVKTCKEEDDRKEDPTCEALEAGTEAKLTCESEEDATTEKCEDAYKVAFEAKLEELKKIADSDTGEKDEDELSLQEQIEKLRNRIISAEEKNDRLKKENDHLKCLAKNGGTNMTYLQAQNMIQQNMAWMNQMMNQMNQFYANTMAQQIESIYSNVGYFMGEQTRLAHTYGVTPMLNNGYINNIAVQGYGSALGVSNAEGFVFTDPAMLNSTRFSPSYIGWGNFASPNLYGQGHMFR